MHIAKDFPPKKIKELDKDSAKNFIQLLKAFKHEKITLFLGAGVSASAGLPTWNELIEKICSVSFLGLDLSSSAIVDNTPFDGTLKKFNDLKSLSKKFSSGNPISVLEQIKTLYNERTWNYILHRALYRYESIYDSKLIIKLAEIIASEKVQYVLNYNYDDLIELKLKEKNVKCESIAFKAFGNSENKFIIHPHGLIPINGGNRTKIIFTESEYINEFTKPYSWTNLVQLDELNKKTCLFIGFSFSDINMLKLIRISRNISNRTHYAFIFESIKEESKMQKLQQNYLYKLGIKTIVLKKPNTNDYSELVRYLELIVSNLHNPDCIWLD